MPKINSNSDGITGTEMVNVLQDERRLYNVSRPTNKNCYR